MDYVACALSNLIYHITLIRMHCSLLIFCMPLSTSLSVKAFILIQNCLQTQKKTSSPNGAFTQKMSLLPKMTPMLTVQVFSVRENFIHILPLTHFKR